MAELLLYISLLQTVGVGPGVVVPPLISSLSSSYSTSISSTVTDSFLTFSMSGFGAERDDERVESDKIDCEEITEEDPCGWSEDKWGWGTCRTEDDAWWEGREDAEEEDELRWWEYGWNAAGRDLGSSFIEDNGICCPACVGFSPPTSPISLDSLSTLKLLSILDSLCNTAEEWLSGRWGDGGRPRGLSLAYWSDLESSSDFEPSRWSMTVSGGGGSGAVDGRPCWEKPCGCLAEFSKWERWSEWEVFEDVNDKSVALSDGFSGGGECGSFLIGTRPGTGGVDWWGLPPTDEDADMATDGWRCGARWAAPAWE